MIYIIKYKPTINNLLTVLVKIVRNIDYLYPVAKKVFLCKTCVNYKLSNSIYKRTFVLNI